MPASLRHPRTAATFASAAAWFCLLATPAGVAQEPPATPPDLVQRAIGRMAGVDVEPWFYRRVLDSREGRRVDRHEPGPDPSRHWVLESVAGRAPTAEELDEYREDQAAHGRRAGDGASDDGGPGETDGDRPDAAADRDGDGRISPAERVAGWFDPGAFAPLPGEPRSYRFRLRSPDGRRENAWAQIEGELHVAGPPEDPWIDRARLWNSESFFAAFGVHMSRVTAEVRFEKVAEHIRPERLEVAFEGWAWLVRELDERLAFSFGDWRPADATDAPTADSP